MNTVPFHPKFSRKKVLNYATNGTLSYLPAETVNLLVYNGGGKNLSKFWGT